MLLLVVVDLGLDQVLVLQVKMDLMHKVEKVAILTSYQEMEDLEAVEQIDLGLVQVLKTF